MKSWSRTGVRHSSQTATLRSKHKIALYPTSSVCCNCSFTSASGDSLTYQVILWWEAHKNEVNDKLPADRRNQAGMKGMVREKIAN